MRIESISPRQFLPTRDAAGRLKLWLWVKRLVDVLFSLTVLVVGAPLFTLIAVLIDLDSPGSIFYRQKRIGMNGMPFEMIKFRTMHSDAEARLIAHLNHDTASRREWELYQKLGEDPRRTRVGVWLRRWSLDELPQFINVLIGDMSIVGPRPMFFGQEKPYGEDFKYYKMVRPGLTGLWQVSGRNRITFEERARLDGHYVRNWSPWLDTWIVLKTPFAILAGEGEPDSGA